MKLAAPIAAALYICIHGKTIKIDEAITRTCSVIDDDLIAFINASSSTRMQKNLEPEMHKINKGNEGHFGMKHHVGVDTGSRLVHCIAVTAENEHDITRAAALIRKDDA